MPVTPTQLRLSPDDLYPIDSLAAGIRDQRDRPGNRTEAVRESAAYWYAVVADAARRNADEIGSDDWHRLAHLNDPTDLAMLDDGPRVVDWSARLAAELCGMWEGRAVVLPEHREAARACRALAKRIGGLGIVRGYAIYAALRWFWCNPDTADAWWWPEIWLTPEVREK